MLDTTAIRKNLKIEIDGDPWIVIDFQFVKPGKGQPFTRTRIKNMITGNVLDKTYKSGEKIGQAARIDERKMAFLYSQGTVYTFMDNENYEQVEITEELVGDAKNFLTDNMTVEVLFFHDRPIGVELPNFVELDIVEIDLAILPDGHQERVLLLSQRLCRGFRQVYINALGHHGGSHHENDQEHKHDVYERCDIDLGNQSF